VSYTRFADAYGRHSLKFGAEIERSTVRTQYQPYGPAGFYIYAYGGVPYYRVSYGYDVQGTNKRTSVYAQDQWNAGRATLNIGLRLDHIRGNSPVLDRDVYKPKAAWGPRIGLSYDLTGKGTTALKAFWGRYYEGAAAAFYTAGTPGIQDTLATHINADGSLGATEVWAPGQVYDIADDIKHPLTDDMNLSFETQILNGVRFTATGMWRNTANFVNNVIADARWQPTTLTNGLTGQPFTAYRWANPDESDESFTIRNLEGFQYIAEDGSVIATLDPERKYRALMLTLSNGLRGRLGYQVSYVLAKAEGNVDNTGFGVWLNGFTWNSPNTAVINNDGELTNSRRHEFKAYLSYLVPRVDIQLGGSYTGLSGRPYAAFQQFGSSQINLPFGTRRQVLLEPRGSRRSDTFHQVDVRAEKAFRVEQHRFGIYADIANLFNDNAVTTYQNRYPSTSILGNTVLPGAPTIVQAGRQITFGARWGF
jgi:hypothetical protein